MSRATSNDKEDLCLKLQQLLSNNKKQKRNVNKLLEAICSHIKSLNGEVDGLSIRISELTASLDNDSGNSIDANILTQLLQQ